MKWDNYKVSKYLSKILNYKKKKKCIVKQSGGYHLHEVMQVNISNGIIKTVHHSMVSSEKNTTSVLFLPKI